MAEQSDLPKLSKAVIRQMGWVILVFVVTGTVVFAATTYRMQRETRMRELIRRASSFAVLASSPLSDLDPGQLKRFVSGSNDILGAAHVTPVRGVVAGFPDPAHLPPPGPYRTEDPATLETTTVALKNGSVTVWRVSVPLMLREGRLVVWARRDRIPPAVLGGTLWFASLLALIGFGCLLWLGRWTHKRVASPLALLATPIDERPRQTRGARRVQCNWSELVDILANLNDSHARLRGAREQIDRGQDAAQHELLEHHKTLQRKLRQTRTQALTDPLTRLLNRRFLDEEFPEILEDQRSAGRDLSLAMIDLDNFKHHNDTHGHQAGDQLLRFAGELFRGATQSGDYAVRYGGDEFVLVLPGLGIEQAYATIDRIVKMFNQFAATLGAEQRVSMSAGLTSLTGADAADVATLLTSADAALYQAKHRGKGQVVVAGQNLPSPVASR